MRVLGASLRGLRLRIAVTHPGIEVSREAVLELKRYLDERAEHLITASLLIHDRENNLRKMLGERPKVRLASRHVRMAIEGRFRNQDGGQG